MQDKTPIQFYVDNALKNMIITAAKKERMTLAGFVRQAVIEKTREIIEGTSR